MAIRDKERRYQLFFERICIGLFGGYRLCFDGMEGFAFRLMKSKHKTKNEFLINLGFKHQKKEMMDSIAAKEYKLVKKLGSGAFGQVFMAIHIKNHSEVAIKLQPRGNKSPQLFYQAKILTHISNDDNSIDHGIPRIYYCGSEGEYNVMVMELFGQSLEDLFVNSGRKFDLKSTLMIGYQMIQRLEFVHNRNYLHRDIKPDNFVIGNGKKAHKVYLIDFGLAKRYIQKDGSHIPYRDNKNLTGTARYASLNTHLGIEQGRRDDIEGVANVLLYFVKGTLPWQNLKAAGKKEKYQKIMDKKLSIPIDTLCVDLVDAFKQLMMYSRTLEFQEKPDYGYLKELFKGAMERQGFQMDYAYCFSRN